MEKLIKCLGVLNLIVGFTLGQYLYQLFRTTPDWSTALDRSYFMAIAAIITAFGVHSMNRMTDNLEKSK